MRITLMHVAMALSHSPTIHIPPFLELALRHHHHHHLNLVLLRLSRDLSFGSHFPYAYCSSEPIMYKGSFGAICIRKMASKTKSSETYFNP